MAGETQFAQLREVADVKGKNEIDKTLTEFGKCAVALRNLLDEDSSLDDMESLFIENHFHVVQMAYLRWKRKHQNKGE